MGGRDPITTKHTIDATDHRAIITEQLSGDEVVALTCAEVTGAGGAPGCNADWLPHVGGPVIVAITRRALTFWDFGPDLASPDPELVAHYSRARVAQDQRRDLDADDISGRARIEFDDGSYVELEPRSELPPRGTA